MSSNQEILETDAGATPGAYSADIAWGLMSRPVDSPMSTASSASWKECTLSELRDVVHQSAEKLFETELGVMQYLEKRYESLAARNEYAKKLWTYFPKDTSETMRLYGELDATTYEARQKSDLQCLHLAMLRFDCQGTHHEPTDVPTSLKLLDEYIMNMFITEGDPLLTISGSRSDMDLAPYAAEPPWASEDRCGHFGDAVPAFSIRHHKSANRVSTLHFLVTLFLDDNVDIKTVHPMLFKTICKINVVNLRFATKRAQVINNFAISHRGEIRKPPSVLSWVHSLTLLRDEYADGDAGSIIRQNNLQGTNASQLVGGKAQSVKNLMDLMPPEALVEVMKAEALYGRDGSPYHEVMFATKKIYAGSHFRAANCKKWTQRMVVTPMSVVCMFKRMNSHWAKTPPMMRRKFSKLDAEELALKCAVVTNLVKEVQAIAMISDEELNQQWVDKYISQDPQIELAVESACCSKDPNYTPRDTEILNALINKHQQGLGTMVAPIEESAVVASASQLEEDTFRLMMKENLHEEKVWEVYLKNLASHRKCMAAKHDEWNLERHRFSADVAEKNMNSWAKVVTYSNGETIPKEFETWKTDIMKRFLGTQIATFNDELTQIATFFMS